ncbi:hypothetical protein FRC12_010291 [Ceratobasidium sp. 428]|nr:hypothetical protein FRC12_010291 [Ceratobasidium sp. 428]
MHWSHLFLLAPSLLSPTYALLNTWTLKEVGTSGVNAMQLAVFSSEVVVFIDKLESNPLRTSTNEHALGARYLLETNSVRPLDIKTNSFCAGGGWLSNGTMVNIGGNPMYESGGTTKDDGLQGIRLINSCGAEKCEVYENPKDLRLTSPRWYPSGCRLSDGSLIIMGGDWTNHPSINNPTCEFFPQKNINGYNGVPIPVPFLVDTMPHNMFPHVISLPGDGDQIFMAANNMAMIYNWKTNQETRLPNLPNGQRCTYPYSGTAVLLPLTPANGYTPEVLICGGSHASNETPDGLSTQTPTSRQCSRMVLNDEGTAKGWQVETMPVPRTMHSSILMPNGLILIINGAQTGTAGYGNVPDQIGQSNADNPAFQAVIYDPNAPAGQRFSSEGLPTSDIPRMYHSTASLLPDGCVIIAGSNPNLDVSTQKYPTEYRVEKLCPSSNLLDKFRPEITGLGPMLDYGSTMKAVLKIPSGLHARSPTDPLIISVSLMDLGFSTHGVHMDQRMVMLDSKMQMLGNVGELVLDIAAPPNASVYPPGPGFIVVSCNGVPSVMHKMLIGGGQDPPVDQGAIKNMLAHKPGQS